LFYVMKRVQGRTLRQYLVDEPNVAARLRAFERLCDPVAFAHDRGVIHRDLKPENVMVGEFGEVTIMDWGGARALGGGSESAGRDDENLVIGTDGFMAPEQARGNRHVDHRADVYGLGAMLFLMLTNDVPAADPAGVLRRVRVAKPLAAICSKALAANPDDRYATAAALGEEIARHRAGLSVAAYREGPIERLLRFERTYRAAILLVVGYIIMRALVAFLAGW
jgi:serine/threonine protein kinase